MKAREGDYLESFEDLLFCVKGLLHPAERIVAFVRYFPDQNGPRKKNGKPYSKIYSLSKRYTFLEESHPDYLVYDSVFDERLCEVPINHVKKHYEPKEKIQELRSSNSRDELEEPALQLTEILKRAANIPWNTIGISGSILVELHGPDSDIDPIVYGSENCWKVYCTLKSLLNEERGTFNPYTRKELEALYEFRSKDTIIDYEDFVRTESRKVLQGKFLHTDYFIRFVKDWSEVNEKYGDVYYANVGYARVKATIVDDSESIFTPCTYKIGNVQVLEGQLKRPLKEITSFRGRFCEQAGEGEAIIAQGKVEHVKHKEKNLEYFRLLLGNKPSDFMILA